MSGSTILHGIRRAALMLAALALPASAQVPAEKAPAKPTTTAVVAPASVAPVKPGQAAALTAADVNAWLDGYMPYALEAGDMAGAVVVVVKDGQVLTQRGFGYADMKRRRPVDPAATLFRPGSISKLYTWTAVMQQVEAGKIDLDKDVNSYIDFKIPDAYGKPITMRDIMTHTAGFAEAIKYLLTYDPKTLDSLEQALKRDTPKRIYAPGAMPAYSNYGAALAGYVVQRVSGEPFDVYVQRHIYAPLGMTHSTFAQPLPAKLRPFMSNGYTRASGEAGKYELIALAPAGSMAGTGADMAKFMIAHLANGGPLLKPETTRLMHAVANRPFSGLPGMALGFYHEDRNGETIVGHGGDTDQFHSDLHLYLDRGVGFYVSFNSAGKDAAAHVAREKMFTYFTDRYFPVPDAKLPTLATAREHGQALAGGYISSRAGAFSFLRLISILGQAKVHLNDDDTISVTALTNPAGVEKRWREVAPWQWQEVGGSERLQAVLENGKVTMFSIGGFAPIFEFLVAPASLNAAWIVPVLLVALAVMLLTALSWPLLAIVRRSYGHKVERTQRALRLHRATRATAWLALIVAGGWMVVLNAINTDLTALNGRLDPWMRVLQLLSLLFIAGTIATLWNSADKLRDVKAHKLTAIWSIAIALSALFLTWFVIDAGLLVPSLNY